MFLGNLLWRDYITERMDDRFPNKDLIKLFQPFLMLLQAGFLMVKCPPCRGNIHIDLEYPFVWFKIRTVLRGYLDTAELDLIRVNCIICVSCDLDQAFM